MSSTFDVLASGSIGILAGTLSGFLGIGGGAILAPLLALTLRVDQPHISQQQAQGISLAALLPPVGLPAVIAYRKLGVRIDARLVVTLIAGFVVGAYGGAWLAHRVSSHALRWIFTGFLLISAWRAMRASTAEDGHGPATAVPVVPVPIGVAIGVTAGVMSGLLGVGGGLIALPMLRRWGGLGRLEAQATTLAMLLPPIGLPAVYVYAQEQHGLPWDLLAAVGVAFALGAGIGAHVAGRVDNRTATRVYAGFLVVIAVVLGLQG